MTKLDRLLGEVLFVQERARSCDEIATHFEVSRRTVIRDMQALVGLGVPVVSRDGPGGGYSISADRTLAPLHLTGQEAVLLMLAFSTVSKMTDTPYSAARAALEAKLRAILPAPQRERVEKILEKVQMEIPERRQKTPLLDELMSKLQDGSTLELSYSGDEGQQTLVVQPQRVFADRGFWYMTAQTQGGSRVFRVDRIIGLRDSNQGVSAKDELPYDHPSHPTVVVRLTQRGLRSLERDPHMTDLPEPTPDGVVHEFRCPPSELRWYAKVFGGLGIDAIVESPPELVNLIRARAENILKIYPVR